MHSFNVLQVSRNLELNVVVRRSDSTITISSTNSIAAPAAQPARPVVVQAAIRTRVVPDAELMLNFIDMMNEIGNRSHVHNDFRSLFSDHPTSNVLTGQVPYDPTSPAYP